MNGYTRGVCWLYWVVIFIPVFLFAILTQLILLLITALLILMTCSKIKLFDKANRKVQEVDITSQIDKLGRVILLVLYILTGPIWFPFWICRSFRLSILMSTFNQESSINYDLGVVLLLRNSKMSVMTTVVRPSDDIRISQLFRTPAFVYA